MKRLFPAPWLSVGLFCLWLALNRSLHPAQLLLALLVAAGAPLLSRPLSPPRPVLHRPRVLLRLLVHVAIDLVVSNLAVARLSLGWGGRKPRSAFVTIPLALRDPSALAMLSIIVAIVPGTVWCELAGDTGALTLHALDVGDVPAFVAHFKDRYERPLQEIFE